MKAKLYTNKEELDKDIDLFLQSLLPRGDNWPIIIQEELDELLNNQMKDNTIYVSTLAYDEYSLTGFRYEYCMGYKRDKKEDMDFIGLFNQDMEYPPEERIDTFRGIGKAGLSQSFSLLMNITFLGDKFTILSRSKSWVGQK